ncbi:hypothetical protein HCA50_14990, partial [Listeria innocua]|nr:hypothetical protein [Listeria innocua]
MLASPVFASFPPFCTDFDKADVLASDSDSLSETDSDVLASDSDSDSLSEMDSDVLASDSDSLSLSETDSDVLASDSDSDSL